MKRLTIAVTALFVVSVLVGAVAQAQGFDLGEGQGRGRPRRAQGVLGPRDGQPAPDGQGDRAGRNLQRAIERMVMLAVTAPWAKDDAKLQHIVNKTIRDRKALHVAEGKAIKAFVAFVDAVREGQSREELEDEIAALREAREARREAVKTLAKDLRAMHERLQELRPQRNADAAGPAGLGREEMRERFQERRKNAKSKIEDLPPVIE